MKRFPYLAGPLPFLALAIVAMGLAIAVGVAVFFAIYPAIEAVTSRWRYPLLGLTLALCYFGYGLAILVIAPVTIRAGATSACAGS